MLGESLESMTNKTLCWLSSLSIVGILGAAYLDYNEISCTGWTYTWHVAWVLPAIFVFVCLPGVAIGELSLRLFKKTLF